MFERIKRTWSLIMKALRDPDTLQVITKTSEKLTDYRIAWAFYKRRMLSVGENWSSYLCEGEYYQHTRLIFNPVPNVIDFYVDNIWSQAQNTAHPKLVVPIADGADDAIIAAVAQLDQWTSWRKEQKEAKAYAAATGNVLIEIVDDLDRQKITQKTIWAGYVSGILLNDAGDVQRYAIEYDCWDDEAKKTYKYQKIVTKETISYFKDDQPFDYFGEGAVIWNPYGFCPAVWIRHAGAGASGESAFVDFDKVIYANSKACHLYDNIDKEIESGKIIGIDDPATIQVLSGGQKNANGSIRETDSRLERVLLAGKGNVSVNDLSGMLKLAEAYPYMTNLLLSFATDYPELEYREILKQGGDLSGVALERLLTPAQNRLDGAAPNYDEQLIKLRQMQIAISGWRCKNGWTNLNSQQRIFAQFDLDSYSKGLLDFNLKRSVLIEQTEEEKEDLLTKKIGNANAADGMLPIDERLKMVGFTDPAEVARLKDQLSKESAAYASAYKMDNPPEDQPQI